MKYITKENIKSVVAILTLVVIVCGLVYFIVNNLIIPLVTCDGIIVEGAFGYECLDCGHK